MKVRSRLSASAADGSEAFPLDFMAPRTKDGGPPPDPSQAQQDECSEGIEEYEMSRMLVMRLARSSVCRVLLAFALLFVRWMAFAVAKGCQVR